MITEPATKPAPVTVSVKLPLLTRARLGEMLYSTGFGLSTVKAVALVAVPPGVVMAITPEVPFAGTVKVRLVAEPTV